MASRGHQGGLAEATADAVLVLDAAGFDVVLVETVGSGQNEVEVRSLAETVVLALMPGSGDGVQAIKAGLMEIPDVLAVTKADRPGADALVSDLRTALGLVPAGPWEPPIVEVSALEGTGARRALGGGGAPPRLPGRRGPPGRAPPRRPRPPAARPGRRPPGAAGGRRGRRGVRRRPDRRGRRPPPRPGSRRSTGCSSAPGSSPSGGPGSRSEAEDERQGLVDGSQLGRVEASGAERPEAPWIDHRRLLDEHARLAAGERDGRPEARGQRRSRTSARRASCCSSRNSSAWTTTA